MGFGVPVLTLDFVTAAREVAQRIKSGVVALIVRDAGVKTGLYTVADPVDIPEGMGTANEAYIAQALEGGINRPQKVLVAVIGAADDLVTKGAAMLTTQDFDYLAGPPDIKAEEKPKLVTWLKKLRETFCIGKVVLPDYAADDVCAINFSASNILVGDKKLGAGDYCSRIAGLLASTPTAYSATCAQLPEVLGVDPVADPAAAVDAGKLILTYDGRVTRLSRAVNSRTTLGPGEREIMRKIKIVEALDLIRVNARRLVESKYQGMGPNDYDHKMLLVAELEGFMRTLESEGLVLKSTGFAMLDLEAQRAWLKEQGVDVASMSNEEILRADTGSKVFFRLGGVLADAMEDFIGVFVVGGNAA